MLFCLSLYLLPIYTVFVFRKKNIYGVGFSVNLHVIFSFYRTINQGLTDLKGPKVTEDLRANR